MTPFDWEAVRRDKDEFHRMAASRSFGEKLAQLDRLRERAQALKGRAQSSPLLAVREPSPLDERTEK